MVTKNMQSRSPRHISLKLDLMSLNVAVIFVYGLGLNADYSCGTKQCNDAAVAKTIPENFYDLEKAIRR